MSKNLSSAAFGKSVLDTNQNYQDAEPSEHLSQLDLEQEDNEYMGEMNQLIMSPKDGSSQSNDIYKQIINPKSPGGKNDS